MQEALVAWTLWGLVAIGVWATYARFPAAELYNVTGTGFAAGAARTLVFLSWPVAIAAVALVVVAADRLLAGSIPGWGRAATGLATAAAIALCATIALPGALDPNDLDARAAKVPAAVAVPLLVIVAIPWILAGVGLYTGDVPVLDDVYISKAVVPEPGEPALRAVHLGNHEGIDGILLAGTAFALRRALRRMRPTPVPLLGGYLALIAVYGMAVAADDFWIEQLQKRGTVSRGLPYVLAPGPRPAWAALVAVACVVYVVAFRVGNDPGSSTARR